MIKLVNAQEIDVILKCMFCIPLDRLRGVCFAAVTYLRLPINNITIKYCHNRKTYLHTKVDKRTNVL